MKWRIVNLVLFFILIYSSYSIGQTVDVSKGCVPLKVNFTAPQLNTYYWDFKDGASSTDANPSHIFTKPGIFKVDLYEGKNGPLKGNLEIYVYADPIITFIGNPVSGCSPLKVEFKSNIVVDTAVKISEILWSFGDGANSDQTNPTHTYANAGQFNVSLKIVTNFGECDKTFLVQDYINVQGIVANFSLTKPNGCDLPTVVNIINTTKNDPDLSYSWDFGNGKTFNGYDPKTATYSSKGSYTVSLKVKDKSGCESISTQKISIGPPQIVLKGKDSFCLKEGIMFKNETVADTFVWEFLNDASLSISKLKEPFVTYASGGVKTIKLRVINGTCKADTVFNIYIEELDPTFTIDAIDCFKDVQIKLEAKQKGKFTYTWNDSIVGTDIYNYLYQSPIRDSFFRHRSDTIYQSLEIKSPLGCKSFYIKYFIHQRPNAVLIPNMKEGCAPLTVGFSDESESKDKIIRWTILYGDGEVGSKTTDDLGNHVYSKPGEYYVKLVIENMKGCVDTSEGFWIVVGEKIIPTFSIDTATICIGEEVTIRNTTGDKRIDSWHVVSDNGRFSHCWKSDVAKHKFVNDVGTFPVSVISEYNGCFAQSSGQMITVKGAVASMKYMVNCATPHDVMFWSKSKNASDLKWNFGDNATSTLDSLTHHFVDRGSYKVSLSAEDKSSGCPATTDTKTIYIKEIKANLSIPEKTCDNQLYVIDATLSQDVDRDCNKGFLYILPSHRPRKNNKDTIMYQFGRTGYQEVTLIVEDINGCKDTMTKGTTSYSITPEFFINDDLVCLPVDLKFRDSSRSDTTILSWDWSFGSKEMHPTYTLRKTDSTIFNLKLTDALGCMDSISKSIRVYKPFSKIRYNKGTGICVGDSVQFNAQDYTTSGSSLNFDWDFGIYGKSKLQNPKIKFDKTGTFKIILNYTEKSSNCGGGDTIEFVVVKIPEAIFDVALPSPLCYPQIFEFKNQSLVEGPVFYTWEFDNKINNNLKDPTFAFGKGKHKVKLSVRSIYGCSSAVEKEYTLIGPEGKIRADKLTLCKGEEGTFSAIDLVDVNEFEWEFNDGGNHFPNTNPVKYKFDSSGQRRVELILKSSDTGCEFIDSILVNVPDVQADFLFIDSLTYCPGLAKFQNTSRGAQQFEWNFGDGIQSKELNPIHNYQQTGKKSVQLTAIDSASKCRSSITKEIDLKDVIEFYKFPNVFSPNNDGVNDFFRVAIKPNYEEYIEVVNFKVYNRWGRLIYNNENPKGWDGRFNDVDAPVEVYAYFIEIKIKDCKNQISKGNVTIIR